MMNERDNSKLKIHYSTFYNKTYLSLHCILLSVLFFLLLSGCARKVRDTQALSKQVVFRYSVIGNLATHNENITYYIILNAPQNRTGQDLDPATEGPRINGASLDLGSAFLEGRLPFTGLLPGDIRSQWTDFYYLKGTPDGKGSMGHGRKLTDGRPEIAEQNYPESLWRKLSNSTFEVQIQFRDLTSGAAAPKNFTVNLATSDNLNSGNGFVFDHWRSNIPFSIRTDERSQIEDRDQTPNLIMRQIPLKPLPQLPAGVNQDDVNILSFQFQIRG